MTRKDYERLADALGDALSKATPGLEYCGVILAASEISVALKADNPRFDAPKFTLRMINAAKTRGGSSTTTQA